MKKIEYVFSFDFECVSLWGTGFSGAAVVYKIESEADKLSVKKVDTFIGRCPYVGHVDDFVNENVIPEMVDIPQDYKSYAELLVAFGNFYMKYPTATKIVHMAFPVETRVLLQMHDLGLFGDFEGPYPLIDIAGNLQQAGFDPTSVDAYNASHGIIVPKENFVGGTHNPLYDSEAAFWCYYNLKYSSDRS